MMRSLMSTLIALVVVRASFAEANHVERRPANFVVFLVDDLGYTDIACFGSSFYETPNVDRLASSGMRLTEAYSTCPVCSPSRASLFTGRYPQRSGITDYINGGGGNQPQNWRRNTKLLPAAYVDRLALGERTIAEMLGDEGYSTFFAGKWHLGPQGFWPEDQGFAINRGGCAWGMPKSYFSPYANRRLADGPVGEHLPARLAEETCTFIESNAACPFLAVLSFYSVHIPLQAPQELVAKYERKAGALASSEHPWGQERASQVRMVQDHPTYAAMVESMDRAVGKVLDTLDRLNLDDNTFVLFTADNGGLATAEGHPTSNLPLRAGKGWLYEGGIRVPTIVRYPELTKRGSSSDAPVIGIDFVPTMLEIAGIAPSDRPPVDGQSIVKLLRGEAMKRESPLFWDYPHYGNQGGSPASAVRDERWKLIHWRESDTYELYDLKADIGETTDLAPTHPAEVERLARLLTSWRESVGAERPSPNADYLADAKDNANRTRKPSD